jgi:Gram-negative bacterial TonB protein C-terminal
LRVETIELLSHVDGASFMPPRDAAGPLGDRISGVDLVPINMSSIPRWAASLRQQHFTIKVKIVVGKDGHVISAHAISGLPEGYKACENAVRKWIFKPYLVLDKPVEVEQTVEYSNN